MYTGRFTFFKLVKSKAFLLTLVLLSIISGAFTFHPLTSRLGFDYSLYFSAVSTILLGHFSWAAFRLRRRYSKGPGIYGTIVRIWLAAFLSLGAPLLVISLNALRVRNCNFTTGFAFFVVMPGVGTILSVATGVSLAVMRRKGWSIALLYLIPLASILWAVYQGLIHPPIFAYGHYFGFFPGTIYDELREVTSTLLLFRLQTITLALFALSLVSLLAGRQGVVGQDTVAWRDALLQRVQGALDGRLRWGLDREAATGTFFLLLLCLAGLMISHRYRHDIGYKQTDFSIQQTLGGRYETKHFVIYYDRDFLSPRKLRRMARDSEFRFQQLERFFGHKPNRKIEIYWFRDVAQKSHLMGAAYTMIARPWAHQFYIHGYGFPHYVIKHEMAHVFTAAFGAGPLKLSVRYGVFFYPALIEGVAVAADWVRGELTPHEWSRAMLDIKGTPDPEQILGPLGFFKHSGWTAYTIAGSFSRYLIETYGIASYKKAYGRATFAEVYRKPLQQLSTEWKQYLRQNVKLGVREAKQAAYRFRRYRSIFVRTCPHAIAALNQKVSRLRRSGARYSAIRVQEKICSFAPRSYQRLRLLQLHVQTKQYKKAVQQIKRMLKDFPAKNYPVVHSRIRRQAGLIAYRRNQLNLAKQHYLIASQQHLSLSEMRHLLVALYALKHSAVTDVIMRYIAPTGSRTARLLALQAASLRNPKEPMLAYLLGRRLYFASQYKAAIPLLQKAAAGFQKLPLRMESLRLHASSHFYLGLYAQAAQLYQNLSKLPLPSGLKRQALDWKERSLWELKTYKTKPTNKPIPHRKRSY